MTRVRGFSPPKTSSSDGLKPINRLRPTSVGVRVISLPTIDARFPLCATTIVIVIVSWYATCHGTIAYYYHGNMEINNNYYNDNHTTTYAYRFYAAAFVRRILYAQRRWRRGVPVIDCRQIHNVARTSCVSDRIRLGNFSFPKPNW